MTDQPVPAASGPERLAAGRFAVYAAADGRLVVAMALEGDDATYHYAMPRTLLKLLARKAGDAGEAELVARLRSLARGAG